MIHSLLDNDQYKFSMQQAVAQLYPRAEVEYKFINRGGTKFPAGFDSRLKTEVFKMIDLQLSYGELEWLKKTCPYFTPVYLELLKGYQYNPDEVSIRQRDGNLDITIRGSWFRTILWEVPLMALISELYFEIEDRFSATRDVRQENNREKARRLRDAGCSFADFGTRRRFSRRNQYEVIQDILSVKGHTLTGTSNVHLANVFDVNPIGTMAHEWIMFHSLDQNFFWANGEAADKWRIVYGEDLNIFLPDTFTLDLGLKPTRSILRKFKGLRQDSGNPFLFIDKVINEYKRRKIDPTIKHIIFSDSLDTDKCIELQKYCAGRINCSFGIGTNLSNDVGVKPLNMVIKMSKATQDPRTSDLQSVIKLSDTPGKYTGDPDKIAAAKKVMGISNDW